MAVKMKMVVANLHAPLSSHINPQHSNNLVPVIYCLLDTDRVQFHQFMKGTDIIIMLPGRKI